MQDRAQRIARDRLIAHCHLVFYMLIGGVLIPIFGLMMIGDGSILDGLSTLTTSR